MDREARKALNSKENKISLIKHTPSSQNMSAGEKVIARRGNKSLGIYIKELGQLWWTYLTKDGNWFVDRDLIVKRNLMVKGQATFDKAIVTTSEGAGAPSGGKNGDIYYDTAGGNVYIKINGTWRVTS